MTDSRKTNQLRDNDERRISYEAEDARVYDPTIRLLSPVYDVLHDTIVELVRITVEWDSASQLRVLDLGCGTGEEAIRLAKALPTAVVVAVDTSREMLAAFEEKLRSSAHRPLAPRIQLVHADITDWDWWTQVHALHSGERYDAVVSAFVLHHFSEETLSELYARVYATLRPGGVFVNGDLFDFRSPELSAFALQVGIDYIRDRLSTAEAREVIARLGGDVTDWRDRWIAHMLNENAPASIEEPLELERAVQQKGHRRLLLESAFSEVACPFRHWQNAVLWARRHELSP